MPTQKKTRPPVIAIMGHIDHGKSTLLLYIRNSIAHKTSDASPKTELKEAGGITQHVSAYEVVHTGEDGTPHTITFLDTPGHEAFSGIRKRGAQVADIAVLVVSAEDGVKPQTIEALHSIRDSKTPFIVAINKIDKPEANIEKTKQNLLENEIYIEGYGGDIPAVAISAKTGQGIPELLNMILLVAELEGLTGDELAPGEGFVIESNRDVKKGITATCVVKNGTVSKGSFIASGESTAPVRMIENYLGKPIDSATFSSPIRVIGWDSLPQVGGAFHVFKTKKDAENYVIEMKEKNKTGEKAATTHSSVPHIAVIVKADTGGSLEAVLQEIKKLGSERIVAHVVSTGIGTISENDIHLANGAEKSLVIGFNVKVEPRATALAERNEIEIKTFDIIYKLSEWLTDALVERTPKTEVMESLGIAKVVKLFSKVKDKQIFGGFVEKGSIALGATVKIMRRDAEIGSGKVRELQQQKVKSSEVPEGKEFGALVEAKVEMAPGDRIESFIMVQK